MPRSAHLKNIAGGLAGSFISRNNDLGGYWAIGKLRLLAEQHGQTNVELDMLAASMQPPSPEFAPVLAQYRLLLAKLTAVTGVRLEVVTSARIMVDFAPQPWPRIRYYKAGWGEQFVVTAFVGGIGRADGIVRNTGYCRPHDPDSERRSTRLSMGL